MFEFKTVENCDYLVYAQYFVQNQLSGASPTNPFSAFSALQSSFTGSAGASELSSIGSDRWVHFKYH